MLGALFFGDRGPVQTRKGWLFGILSAFALFIFSAQGQQGIELPSRHVPAAVLSGQARPVGSLPSTPRVNLSPVLPPQRTDDLCSTGEE